MKIFPKIIEIISVEPYTIICRWNTGEIRSNNFLEVIVKYPELENPKVFLTVTLIDYSLTWQTVRQEIMLEGKKISLPLDFDNFVLYQESILIQKFPTTKKIGEILKKNV
jgi:hypothetical protein